MRSRSDLRSRGDPQKNDRIGEKQPSADSHPISWSERNRLLLFDKDLHSQVLMRVFFSLLKKTPATVDLPHCRVEGHHETHC